MPYREQYEDPVEARGRLLHAALLREARELRESYVFPEPIEAPASPARTLRVVHSAPPA